MKKDGLWGMIDKNGEIVVPFRYDYLQALSEGLIAAEVDGKFGYINLKGDVVIEFMYHNVEPFRDGLASVSSHYADGYGLVCAYIDKEGNYVYKEEGFITPELPVD